MHLSDSNAKICMLRTNSGYARCIKPVRLPPNTEVVIPVSISRHTQGHQVLLEPTQSTVVKGLIVARCVVEVGTGKSVVRLINSSANHVFLPGHYVIAKVEVFDNDHVQT